MTDRSVAAELALRRGVAASASRGISCDEVYQVFYRLIDQLRASGDLLDFGSGAGTLASHLYKSGRFRSVAAVDLMPRPGDLDDSILWVSLDLNDPTPFSDGSFDMIVTAEVIEHLENPRAVARDWFRLLRPGGTVVLSTPNNESWRSLSTLLLAGHFAAFRDGSYPAHITALLRKDIERVLAEAGFSPPTFVFTNLGSIPKMPRIYWQSLSGGLLRGVRYSDNVLAITRKPPLDGTSVELD